MMMTWLTIGAFVTVVLSCTRLLRVLRAVRRRWPEQRERMRRRGDEGNRGALEARRLL